MKKNLSAVFVFSLVFSFAILADAQGVLADVLTAPVVSIGSGNGNTPANQGPVSGRAYHGFIPVYVTVQDDDLDNYHFRVIKDGGSEGHTCVGLGALFAPENQGYASTTQSKDACGFNYNQSVYVSSIGFTDTLIATLNTSDLSAFGGEGDYWLILGARDAAGNRASSDYQTDTRVKITVDNTVPVTVGTATTISAESPIVISGTSTDAHGLSTVTLASANYDGTSCGVFSDIQTLNGNNMNSFAWTYSWSPITGNYCVQARATDTAGNIETPVTVGTNIIHTETVAPAPAPAPAPAVSTGGGNGPVVGSFGSVNSSASVASTMLTAPVNPAFANFGTPTPVADAGTAPTAVVASNSGLTSGNSAGVTVASAATEPTVMESSNAPTTTESSQVAQALSSGFNFNWIWVLVAALALGGAAYYLLRERNN